MIRRIPTAVAAAGILIFAAHLTGCDGGPREKSELELKFEKVATGQTMDEVIELMGEPSSKSTEVEEEEDYFESDDGTMKVPRGSTIYVWLYDEERHSYVVWFADNNDADDPKNVVYMHMRISVGPTVQVK